MCFDCLEERIITSQDLAKELTRLHSKLKKEGCILFGILYANELNELKKSGGSIDETVREAFKDNVNISRNSYITEVRAGIKLSDYVQTKPDSSI